MEGKIWRHMPLPNAKKQSFGIQRRPRLLATRGTKAHSAAKTQVRPDFKMQRQQHPEMRAVCQPGLLLH